MKTLTVLLCQNQSAWDHVIQSIPCLCWGILVLAFLYFILRFGIRPYLANSHERSLRKMAFQNEQNAMDKSQDIKDKELERKIREFNELTKALNKEELERKIQEFERLTIHQDLLNKVTGKTSDIEELKKSFEKLQKQFDTLNGEIENIVIRKK